MKWLLLFAFIACSISAHSQSSADTSGNAYKEVAKKIYTSQNESFLASLKTTTTDKKLYKYYESNYKDVFEAVSERVKEGQAIYIPAISAALEEILQEIKAKNPAVPRDIKVFLFRDGIANAYTVGDNNVFINLGLLSWFENEDQLASVLSHEIGHILMTHTTKTMSYRYQKDKESVAVVKTIREAGTKKADRALDLLKNAIYEGGRITREHEMQADSVGYELLKNTRYRKTAFIETLEILERIDTLSPGDLNADTYKQFFDLPEQKFEDKWLTVEDFSSYNYNSYAEKFNEDSLSSHPQIRERIQYLSRIFPDFTRGTGPEPSATFAELRSLSKKEYIPNLYFNEQYGEVVYFSLLSLQKDPNDVFYRNWLAKGFFKVYQARRDYQLNKFLDRIDPKNQKESYIRFLSFMWNLKLAEIKSISDFYSANG